MPTLERITVFPVKSLDPERHESVTVGEQGALVGDREYGIVGADGEFVTGKRDQRIHRIRSSYDPESRTLSLRRQGDEEWTTFDLASDREDADAWLSAFFDEDVSLRRDADGGFPDNTSSAHGPTVISTATLETVASWFPDLTLDGARRRFRANLEVGGVPAFWEDRLVPADGHVVAFRVGDVLLEGVKAVPRCVVPTRDPLTGEPDDGFRERFIRQREATFPEWVDPDRFDHSYSLMTGTRVPESEWGSSLAVGDEVELVGERSVE
ncbi:MOSC domain-containing protein [Halobacteriaceae archaeon GCM10025711]